VQLKEDTTSPLLIDFPHPQMAARIAKNHLSSTLAATSRPHPRKNEPRCYLLHARSGHILKNHKPCRRPGRCLQLHRIFDPRTGHAADHDERVLAKGCFCWKLSAYQRGPDGCPSQGSIRSDVCPQDCIAGDSERQLRFGCYARVRDNMETQWLPQFMDDQTVTFKCQMNDLYLAAEDTDGVWTLTLSGAPDAWILVPAECAFTPRAAKAMVAGTVVGSAGAASFVGGGAALYCASACTLGPDAAAAILVVGASVAMQQAVPPADDSFWVDKARH